MAALSLDLGPLREPLGLVRGLQWLFSIFAFATCGGFAGSAQVLISCLGGNHSVSAHFAYPFRLHRERFEPALGRECNRSWGPAQLLGDFSPAAQLFVAVAVLSFLYSLLALGALLALLPTYRGAGARLPLVDFLATVTFSFLWLLSSSAWAKALGDIKASLAAPLPFCHPPEVLCSQPLLSSLSSLNVSVLFGFLNLLLWLGSSWFVYKETNLHRPAPGPAPPPLGQSAPASL